MITSSILHVALLLAVRSEWVEISQRKYQKPARSSTVTTDKDTTIMKKDPHIHNLKESSSTISDVQSVKPSDYANISLNHHWSKGSVIKVPGSIAGTHFKKKPANNNDEININSEVYHEAGNEAIISKISAPSFVSNLDNITKRGTNNKIGIIDNVKSDKPHDYYSTLSEHNIKKENRKTNLHDLNEDSAELYDISNSPTKKPSATSIESNTVRKKGYGNRIYIFTTEQPPNDLIIEKNNYVSNIQYYNKSGVDKAHVTVNKENMRRIYVQDVKKPNESTLTDIKDTINKKNVFAETSDKHDSGTKNSKVATNDQRNTQSEKLYDKASDRKTRPIIRIYLNNLEESDKGKQSSSLNPYTNLSENAMLDYDVFFDHALEVQGTTDKTVTKQSISLRKTGDKSAKTNEKHDIPENMYQTNEFMNMSINAEDVHKDYNDDDTPFKKIDKTLINNHPDTEFITKQEYIDDDVSDRFKDYEKTVNITKSKESIANFKKTQENLKLSEEILDEQGNHTKNNENDNNPHHIKDSDIKNKDSLSKQSKSKNEKSPNTLRNIINFMKIVSETISKNTHRGIKSKMRYLEDLRDTLLMNIQDKVDETWPDDDSPQQKTRQRREARGHVQFPSSEGALMSISFLTFAVFLIKLVLQVIHTYKNKAMMMTPTVLAVSRAAAALRSNTHD